MTNERRVLVHPDKASLASSVSARFITKMLDILDTQAVAHVVLTGGSMGSAVLEAVSASPARMTIDWSRVHFWTTSTCPTRTCTPSPPPTPA
jgi:6-phosphogluconolactonase